MSRTFADRTEAGQRLARALHAYAGRTDLLVLALRRGSPSSMRRSSPHERLFGLA